MTIDKSKLIELLVDKTGMEEKQVEEQLSLLVLRVQQAAVQGKGFEIQGLGTFSIKDDALHFEPSKTLETEINHKYAGMKPIELIGAFKDIPPSEADNSPPKPDAGTPAQAESEVPPKRERSIEEILGIGQASDPPTEPQETPEPSSILQPDEQKESPAASFVSDDDPEADTADPFDIDIDENELIFGPDEDSADNEETLKEKDPIGRVLIICVTLIVLGVAGWSVYELDLLNFSTGDTSARQPQPHPVENPIRTASDQADETERQTAGVSVPEAGNTDTPAAGDSKSGTTEPDREVANNIPDEPAVYGLKGTVNPEANGGYTIIVHSLRQLDKAQNQQAELTSQGYRVILTEAVVDGRTYWRVGLGQFETLANAKEASRSLPEPYASNHFIKRIN